ncbi:MAG: HAD family hydrolase [bacterium]|nr:HAD family hydrolase [bacterium]
MSKETVGVRAVFLDRDGTINEDTDYVSDPKKVCLIQGVREAIRTLNEHSIPVIVITNQSGVARGLHTESDIELVNAAISKQLKKGGAHIDRFYHCPHYPEGKGKYVVDCECRKPKPGMLLRASKELKLDLSRSIMIGDKASDIEAGIAAGCRTVLVMTGQGHQTQDTWHESFKASHIAQNLPEAVAWFLGEGV